MAGSYPEADEALAPDNNPANDPFASFAEFFAWLLKEKHLGMSPIGGISAREQKYHLKQTA